MKWLLDLLRRLFGFAPQPSKQELPTTPFEAGNKLYLVHPDLVKVVKLAANRFNFKIAEGARTPEQQAINVAKGVSQTSNSRHLITTNGLCHAVDLWPIHNGKVTFEWEIDGRKPYHEMAAVMKQCAAELGIPIEWGGDWKSLKDGPHFQLPRSKYP